MAANANKFQALAANYANNEAYAKEAAETLPFAQILNEEGVIGIEVPSKNSDEGQTPAERSNFDVDRAKENGWKETIVKFTKGKTKVALELIATDKPRFHVIQKRAVKVDRDGFEVYDTLMLVVFVDNNNDPLHEGVLQLRLRGKSTASATFYEVFDKLKDRDGKRCECFLTNIWGIIPRASKKLQALFVFESDTIADLVGKKNAQSLACRFTNWTEIDEDNIEQYFIGMDFDGTEESKSARQKHIEGLFDHWKENWVYNKAKKDDEPQAKKSLKDTYSNYYNDVIDDSDVPY
ncbi:hypothetical protein BLD44_028500 [Mastigocladus laminosus UU774]|nr:hypothetical protein BLD44_028500 [Mastigocladus laminosus UU774]